MCNAVRDGAFGHRQRFLDGFCAIVKPWQYVAMEINHIVGYSMFQRSQGLPRAQDKHQYSEDLTHTARLDSFGDFCAEDAANEKTGNEQNSHKPGNISRLSVGDHCEQTGWRNQCDDACPLSFMLIERQQQAKDRDQNDSAADSKEPGSDSTRDSGQQKHDFLFHVTRRLRWRLRNARGM